MPIAHLNNINIYYETHGTGEPLLLIMGLGGDSSHWSLQVPLLAQHYQVITFDNRGAGRSDAPLDNYTTEIMAQDAALLLAHLNIATAHVLGFSMGGYIAQQLALQHPTKIKSLILSHCGARSSERSRYLMATMARMTTEGVAREIRLRSFIPWMFSAGFLADEHALNNLTNLALNPLYPQSKQGYIGQITAVRQHDTHDAIQQLRMPILLMTSREDLLIPYQQVQAMTQYLPHAQVALLERGGHCSYIENAADYNRLVLKFLQQFN